MTNKREMDETTSRNVFNRSRKIYLEKKGKIHCSYCPYHKYENVRHIPTKNWKEQRKTRHQWKGKPR